MEIRGVEVFNGIPSNATKSSRPLKLRNVDNVRFQITGDEASTPVGKFEFFGSESRVAEQDLQLMISGGESSPDLARWTKLNIPEQAVHGSGFTPFSDVQDHIDWDGSTELNMWVDLNDPPAYMYVKWTRSSGGAAGERIFCTSGFRNG